VKKPERLEALAYVVLLAIATMVRAIIQRQARHYAEAKGEELPIPGERMTKRPTARMILDSFDAVIVMILSPTAAECCPNRRCLPTRCSGLWECRRPSTLPSRAKRETPKNSEPECARVLKMGH
jgi:hypothetical protein